MAQKPQDVHHKDEIVPTSGIYECITCENITAFKKGEHFTLCPDCDTPAGKQEWKYTDEFVRFESKNVNIEFEGGISYKIAHAIGVFAGNVWFIYFHALWFGVWIYCNTGTRILTHIGGFDPYPFPFLVLIVSLEAIFLATFILITQNVDAQRNELKAEIDYQARLKMEKDVAEALSILNDIREGRLLLTKKNKIIFDEEDS